MTIEETKMILEKLDFPKKYITEQKAICIMALADKKERIGLLSGHKNLSQGARIHDIMNFARIVIGKNVAENTREAYRKTSLVQLMNYGLIVRHQLSTNDPNTYYRLHPDFARIFTEMSSEEKGKLLSQIQIKSVRPKDRVDAATSFKIGINVRIDTENSFFLSPGKHNLLEKAVVEIFANVFLDESQVVYIGDAALRKGYQNRTLMRRLNLPIDTTTSLPDVILFSEPESKLVIVEVVMNSGPVTPLRLEQLKRFAKGSRKLGHNIIYVSAFPSRATFRRLVEDIAWGSSVWIENEPNNVVHFERIDTYE